MGAPGLPDLKALPVKQCPSGQTWARAVEQPWSWKAGGIRRPGRRGRATSPTAGVVQVEPVESGDETR